MMTLADFLQLVTVGIPRFRVNAPNAQQRACISSHASEPLFIVAGPGSGKTTVLVLRALRYMLVEGFEPQSIVITTFTRKAASEIRSRLIEWGTDLLDAAKANPPTGTSVAWLNGIDVNQCVTGTLDSICEEVLRVHRQVQQPAPVLVEGFVGNALLAKKGMWPSGAGNNQPLRQYLAPFTLDGRAPRNFGNTLEVVRTLVDRLILDRVNLGTYTSEVTHTASRQLVVQALNNYRQNMASTNRMDFAGLEDLFLHRLQTAQLQRFTQGLRALLVDEYQDTNPLQEQIYFELVRTAGVPITVVGDDDQSLYRFRGATVDLFTSFDQRLRQSIPSVAAVHRENLYVNYRSTPEVVSFFNSFIGYDGEFQPARVNPPKPLIQAQLPSNGYPVLGLFRSDAQTLAADLTRFLRDVFSGNGHQFQHGGRPITFRKATTDGNLGDAVLLCSSVREYASAWGNAAPRERLPKLLRDSLGPQGVFNPRGRAIRDVREVQILLGLMLECIDPTPRGGQPLVQSGEARLTAEAVRYFNEWRTQAAAFIATNPQPTNPRSLNDFVAAWGRRQPQQNIAQWPEEWPLLELCFKLLSWIPQLQNDPEGQIHLEAVARCIAQAATFSSYRSLIYHGQGQHDRGSIKAALWDVFAPLGENDIDADEDLMSHIPRDRLPIMTIHQAKGLEFPLVMVDVSSDYAGRESWTNRFRRFPDRNYSVQNMEDDLATHCPVGPARVARTARDRAFDDLVRLYYVAYSRPQSLLLLVGTTKCLEFDSSIKHVALQWARDGTWAWQGPHQGKPPAIADRIPLVLI
ncbi:MAG: UvrD-helicase domain-containing protein [Planctomycetota bacterium]|nr:UvrD-helicase domain-containing protein [Planctomycetota bacterium]